jgi:hypothetical protein
MRSMNPPHAPAMTPIIDTDSAWEGKGQRAKEKVEKIRKGGEGKKRKRKI